MKGLIISLLSDNPESWFAPFATQLAKDLSSRGHRVKICKDQSKLMKGDLAFFVSCEEIVGKQALELNKHSLVVHASAVPKGRGMSPLTWQIIEGKNEIPISLFEAVEKVDSGNVFLRDVIKFEGHELIGELRKALGKKVAEMILKFVDKYPNLKGLPQKGKGFQYLRRTPADSVLDVNKSIAQQFNKLRIVDNQRYPAFFYFKGNKYFLTLKREAINPKVSVIIRTYNYGQFIEKSLKSALNQTMAKNEFEIIVIDDGSADNTKQVLKPYKKMIRLFERKHFGYMASSEFGFRKANGKYVIQLDADDWIEPQALETMAAELDKDMKVGFVYCDIMLIKDGQKKVISLQKFELFKMLACNTMFRAASLKEVSKNGKVYDKNMPCFAEFDLLLRLMKKTKKIHIAKPFYNYLKHGKSITANKKNVEAGRRAFMKKHGFSGKTI